MLKNFDLINIKIFNFNFKVYSIILFNLVKFNIKNLYKLYL